MLLNLHFMNYVGTPMAAGDYLALAQSFQSFIITDIPYLSIDVRDQVRRFITFLDAIYDNHGRIAVTSANSFKDLFVEPENIEKIIIMNCTKRRNRLKQILLLWRRRRRKKRKKTMNWLLNMDLIN